MTGRAASGPVAEAQDGCWRHIGSIAGKGKLPKNPHQDLEEGQCLLKLVNKVGSHNCSRAWMKTVLAKALKYRNHLWPPLPQSPSKGCGMCFPCVYYSMQFSLMLALENCSRHSRWLEVSGIHGLGKECISISVRFLCFSWISTNSATVHPHASVGSPRVLISTSPPLLTRCSKTVHQTHCLIVYLLLISKAETLNRGNSSSSGFMLHSKHVIPAIYFSFTLV